MKGLETNEINFSESFRNRDFRIDSDFWTKIPKENPNIEYVSIGSILKTSQYGISIAMNELGSGFPIYRMNEIHNMICDFEVSKCAEVTPKELPLFTLNDRDVLFNRTNSYEWVGRTGIFRKTQEKDYIFASYLVRFVPDEKIILPEYLTTFLNTSYGVLDIRRRSRRSINQTNVNPEEVKAIRIPKLSLSIQTIIKLCFDLSINMLQSSEKAYKDSKNLMSSKLQIKGFSPQKQTTNIKSFKESFSKTGRLDAEFYQTKFDDLDKRLEMHNQLFRLGEKLTYNQRGSQPDYTGTDEGLPVINSKHVQRGEVLLTDNRYAEYPDKKNPVIIQKGDVLINGTGVGTIGRAAPYLYDFPALPDNHVTVLRTNAMTPTCLALYLNSIAGQLQVEKYFKGSSGQIELYPADIDSFWCPVIDPEIQKQIDDLAQESIAMKAESERLLEAAKRAVEIAIEQDEAAGMAHIQQETANYDL